MLTWAGQVALHGAVPVLLIWNFYGAYLYTLTTACALGNVHITRLLIYGCGKMSRLSTKFFKFRICQKLYVQMPADLDQFR